MKTPHIATSGSVQPACSACRCASGSRMGIWVPFGRRKHQTIDGERRIVGKCSRCLGHLASIRGEWKGCYQLDDGSWALRPIYVPGDVVAGVGFVYGEAGVKDFERRYLLEQNIDYTEENSG
jgi:hypothetical protein